MNSPHPFASFAALMQHLTTTGLFHMDLRLNRTYEALALLFPQHTMRVVQVLGTNGKGSTSTFLAALGRAYGLRTGLYTSPHFISPRERIRIDGCMLPEAVWLRWGNRIHSVAPTLTYFEFITVLAICAFQEAGVELAIMEAGLGGRHDATTALPADVLCYTPIAMDHESVLGDSLAAIAADKADAIRHGVTVITGPQKPEVLDILQQRAASVGCTLISMGTNVGADTSVAASPKTPAQHFSAPSATSALLPPNTHLHMHGPHQQGNACLALTAWQHLAQLCGWNAWGTNTDQIRTALEQAFIPGRLQYIPARQGLPALFLDGGHNPHGLMALATALRQQSARPQAVIFSCLADKNIAEMIQPLHDLAGTAPIIVPTITDNPRASAATDLAQHIGPQAVPCDTLAEALTLLQAIVKPPVAQPELTRPKSSAPALNQPAPSQQPYAVLCGSLYLLSEFYTLYPDLLEPFPTTQEPV